MSYSTTYDRLMTAAARAVGLDRAQLDDDEAQEIQDAPNEAVDMIAHAREWPSLIVAWSFTTTAEQVYVFLPTDFEQFVRGEELSYAAGSSYGPLRAQDMAFMRRNRVRGEYLAPPQYYALGPTVADGSGNDGKRELHLWPTPDTSTHTIEGAYRRKPRAMSDPADLPDLPTQLHRAVLIATRMAARESLNQEIPQGWMQTYEHFLEQAAGVLLVDDAMNGEPLADVMGSGPFGDLPVGKNRDLVAGWGT